MRRPRRTDRADQDGVHRFSVESAQGLSNPDVATKLFVSRNTVKAHVAHVYAKLGISTRSELAAKVTRRLTQADA